jgi:hypothetical protein
VAVRTIFAVRAIIYLADFTGKAFYVLNRKAPTANRGNPGLHGHTNHDRSVPKMQTEKLRETEIRMRSIEAAASVSAPSDDIGNLLIHSDWITSYVITGIMPEIKSNESAVARRVIVHH